MIDASKISAPWVVLYSNKDVELKKMEEERYKLYLDVQSDRIEFDNERVM